MIALQNMIGQKYGRLTIVSEGGYKTLPCGQRYRVVLCTCECGTTHTTSLHALRQGGSKSCGCLQKELAQQRAKNRIIVKRYCSITGCSRPHVAKGFCTLHWQRSHVGREIRTWKEQFIIDNPPSSDIGLVPLTRGKVATVDAEDWEGIMQYQWQANKTNYAVRIDKNVTPQKAHWMHREVLNVPDGKFCDHINGDTLDCRKANLRIVTTQQNAMNKKPRSGSKSSRFKGVCFNIGNNRWQSSIGYKNKQYFIGYFDTEYDAAIAYNIAAQLFFGEYSRLNII